MPIDVRTITDAEVPAWSTALNTGFLTPAGDVDADLRRAFMELDRTWAGFDGDRLIATLRSFPTGLTVPGGGTVPVSAVTCVSTTSTHRRQGIASRLALAENVERAALTILRDAKPGRVLPTNLEFYTAILLEAVGFPPQAFAAAFAMGRIIGWIAHAREQQKVGRLLRPLSKYVGPPVEMAA